MDRELLMNSQIEYEQVFIPDFNQLAELLILAKGAERTMLEFSEVTGINTSTLSRIANARLKRALSFDSLVSIYKNKSSKAQFSFSELLRANGMRVKSISQDQSNYRTYFVPRYERHAKNAIVEALLCRGVKVQDIPEAKDYFGKAAPYGLHAHYDFGFLIDYSPYKYWCFAVIGGNKIPTGTGFLNRKFAEVFLLDSWHTEYFENKKYTFVFINTDIYRLFIHQYKGAPIKSAISAMLIDVDTEEIIEEIWISSTPEIENILNRPVANKNGEIHACEYDGEDIDFGDDWLNELYKLR